MASPRYPLHKQTWAANPKLGYAYLPIGLGENTIYALMQAHPLTSPFHT